MSVLFVAAEPEDLQGALPWCARFATARQTSLQLVLLTQVDEASTSKPAKSTKESADGKITSALRVAADEAILALANATEALESEQVGKGDENRESDEQVKDTSAGSETQRPELITLRTAQAEKALLETVVEQKVSLLILSHRAHSKHPWAKFLFEQAPCDVMILRVGTEPPATMKRILVPVGRGPNVQAALKLATTMAEQQSDQASEADNKLAGQRSLCQVTALFVEREVGEDSEALGKHLLRRELRKAGVLDHADLVERVEIAEQIHTGIKRASDAETDLLLFGASDQGFIRRTLFSSVPDLLIAGPSEGTIAILRVAPPFVERTHTRLIHWLERYVPQLEREERVQLFERLQRGSELRLDFVALICLSTAIAALGLMQSSTAVVIGAMLVAPLMTPILGVGLGLVQGNIVLVRRAALSVFVGFVLSLLVGTLLGLSNPWLHHLTSELLGRGQPGVLDLLVALFSGVAAAYALARPGLLEALPGVAIAAALVPPVATIGISISLNAWDNAKGAAFLFGTNVVAIVLASALTMYILGVRPRLEKSRTRLWSRRVLILVFLIVLGIAFPLGTWRYEKNKQTFSGLQKGLQRLLVDRPDVGIGDVRLSRFHNRPVLLVEIHAQRPLSRKLREAMMARAMQTQSPAIPVRLLWIKAWDSAARNRSGHRAQSSLLPSSKPAIPIR